MKFVDVTNDIAFRKIFGNANRKATLISFLNAVINLPEGNQIMDVEITDPCQLGNLSGGNSTIVDVKAKDEKDNIFIVEMQIAEFDFFHKRILYYTSQSYVSQIDKGVGYTRLRPVYFIGILEFKIGKGENYFSRHKVLDVETKEQVIQDVEFNFIELPKFDKPIDQLATSIDQWTYFIKNAENLSVIPESVKDEGLREAYAEASKQNWTKQELYDYDKASIKEQDDIGRIEFAVRKAVEKAVVIAEEKAENKGKADRNLEVSKTAKKMGLLVDDIIKLTGLTKEEIDKL